MCWLHLINAHRRLAAQDFPCLRSTSKLIANESCRDETPPQPAKHNSAHFIQMMDL